jgi:hypothetical protein
MSDDPVTSDESESRHDVVVVGGGPAGTAAAVFTARYGLDTVVFDRGSGSLDRCAFLANYPGFPAGIDIETFGELCREQALEGGSDVVADLVERIERTSGENGNFRVETQDGRRVVSEQVVAATRLTGEYLRPLGGDAMFEVHEHGGEEHEHFDPDYADADGRTPVEGLYVASPSGQRDVQAVVAAGQGAHAARSLVEDRRAVRGYPRELAKHYDWLRPESEFGGAWGERERWYEWYDERVPADTDTDPVTLETLRESYVDDAFATRRTDDEVDALTERAHRRLATSLDAEAVLDALDDDVIRDYLANAE